MMRRAPSRIAVPIGVPPATAPSTSKGSPICTGGNTPPDGGTGNHSLDDGSLREHDLRSRRELGTDDVQRNRDLFEAAVGQVALHHSPAARAGPRYDRAMPQGPVTSARR